MLNERLGRLKALAIDETRKLFQIFLYLWILLSLFSLHKALVQLPTAIFGAPIGGEAPDFRAPLPGSPISESMSSWNGLICSA
jgi:hypothetical protein